MTEITYDLSLLQQSEAKWKNSSALRLLYADMYHRILSELPQGPILELGSGIGNGKEFIPNLITSDIVKTPYVDRAEDCYAISPANKVTPDNAGEGWAGLIALDVLHHLRFPMKFFARSAEVLRPGGRIVLTEPAATPFGIAFYRACHPEPIAPDDILPPYEFAHNGDGQEFANMGMAVGLFVTQKPTVQKQLATLGLQITRLEYRDCLAYPLTGGYSKPQMLPTPLIKLLLAIDKAMPQTILKLLALRMVITIQKN